MINYWTKIFNVPWGVGGGGGTNLFELIFTHGQNEKYSVTAGAKRIPVLVYAKITKLGLDPRHQRNARHTGCILNKYLLFGEIFRHKTTVSSDFLPLFDSLGSFK
jgi:hypothetical protein